MTQGGDFWTRRKARVLEEEHDEARAAEARAQALRDAELEEKPDDVILEELGLPDPDTLAPGDDFKAFMSRAVPERLRRRALRRLWLSNPALANLDGLIDYGEDFTDSATVIENMQTVYQVGKGMAARFEEMMGERDAPGTDVLAEDAGNGKAAAEPETAPSAVAASDTAEEMPPEAEPEPEDDRVFAELPRRRMHFTFDERAGGEA